jgi:dinuclear metal center YbgI/SA1388 family protein
MRLKELTAYLETVIPLAFQESYDNSGLQTGDPEKEIKSGLLVLDVTEKVLDEAISYGCDVIVSHHPLIFQPIRSLTGKTIPERLLIKALNNGIAIYSAHTNLDVLRNGVSRKLAEKLQLKNVRVLSPLKNTLLKLVVYIPESHADIVKKSIFDAGAGVNGNYDHCGFSVEGKGTFRGNDKSNPFIGERGKLHTENEIRFETVLYAHLKSRVIKAMLQTHPYEEVAYDLYMLENDNTEIGLGCVGELEKPLKTSEFLAFVSEVLEANGIRYSSYSGGLIKKVALCGGAGSSLVNAAITSGADAFITGDVKYHSFSELSDDILLVDAGHYETEKFAPEILNDLIIKKFPKFAVRFSGTNTNPINYL